MNLSEINRFLENLDTLSSKIKSVKFEIEFKDSVTKSTESTEKPQILNEVEFPYDMNMEL